MRDAFGREIDYLRVSITDRCDLRCAYCMPGAFAFIPHDEILRYEEILRVCAAAAKTGIRTIKATGGEPLMRKGCLPFLEALRALPGIEHVTLTTNGTRLEPHVKALADLRLDSVNMSLDTLDPETYRRITGVDAFHQVWRAFQKGLEAGLRIKLNCVPIRGVNERDILPIARLAEAFPVDVRFIELMPALGSEGAALAGVPAPEIIALLGGEYPDLSPDSAAHGFGPARYYKSGRLRGGIGFIDAISNHFCSGCNRLRLTSEGFLKLCLYRDDGADMRRMLRSEASDEEIEAAIRLAISNKPQGRSVGEDGDPEEGIFMMPRIGG